MTNRFKRIIVIWILAAATAFVAEPYLVAWWFSATAPQTISPRADLTETERTTIKLFQTVSPSVVSVFARKNPQELFLARGRRDRSSDGNRNYLGCRRTSDHQFPRHQGNRPICSASSLWRVRSRASCRHRTELRSRCVPVGKDPSPASSNRGREFRGPPSWAVGLRHRQSLWFGTNPNIGDCQRVAPANTNDGGT